ncbi:hypothetical protein [Chryseobacterium caseinilyticum]|uniref:Uncharacterized protein n=1 Tax=Chryseobacterium caseinilyticum TaxID=2771428 RepID=A0ABR8ZI63_9FLAO|nr:hypothetical protein [Chryseobacterium caseinilyticum]MBD8084493.1 hypothetical protein [Chryseobacterium caseinilyticum]
MNNIDKKEIGISIVKSAFSNIPFAGQLLTEVLFDYRGRIKQNRLNKFIELLSQYFSQNSDVVFENMKSEDFSDLLELVLKKVVDTKSEEKLRRFKDILVNSITTDIDYNNSERYLDLVSNLSEKDIQILKGHQLFDSNFDERLDYQKINAKLLGDLEKNMNEEIKLRDDGFANSWQNAVSQFNSLKASMRTFDEQNKSVEIYRNAEFYSIENDEFLYSKQKLFSLGLLIDSGAGKFDYKPFHMMSITEFAKKFLEFIKK